MKFASDDKMNQIFDGYTFAIVLSIGHSYDQKRELREKITSRGGTISYLITKKCHFLILSDVHLQKDSTQMKTAIKYDIPIVPVHFLDDCISDGKVVNCDQYIDQSLESDGQLDENFTKGVIAVNDSMTTTTKRLQKPLKVWKFLDPDGPEFHNGHYQVVKFALLINKEYGMRKGEVPFCVLEIHVSSNEDSDFRFCIYVNSGSLNVHKREKTKTSHREVKITTNKSWINNCRYCNDVTQVLDTYSKLHKTFTSPPQSMVNWSTKDTDVDIPSNIGSPQFQTELVTQKKPDVQVAELVNHLWIEAVGQLDTVLSVKVGSLSLEKIEKADGLLNEIYKLLDSGQSDADQRLEKEFYDHVPQKNRSPLTTKAELVRQHELVQLIRDIVSTSEAIGTDEPKDSIVARYSALDCFVTHLSSDSEEFDEVSKIVLTSQRDTDIRIRNIFSLRRPLEEVTFRHNLSNTMVLFHASTVRNFVGILSRGLLLPKMVISDGSHGPGNLGSGIYFSSSSSTSSRYAKASGTTRTRLLLVAQVALGSCFETKNKLLHLKQPPEGFQSVHGIRNTENDPSDFEDDEYVIFRSDQQHLKYLVEFSLPDDDLGSSPPVSVSCSKISKPMDSPIVENITKIEDLRAIPFEVDRSQDVQFGLQSKNNLPAFLRSVHVRATLVDLAAKVVVMQEYTNNSIVSIEAKYVFPLDEMGAVCGFEAFINGKHVVGIIEEKQQAHQTYKKAITEGHGAYLLDQETPDVFVVSVGNLPAGAKVLIKITYVTELATEDELINFCLPGSVAPWQKNLSSLDQAMKHSVTTDNSQTKETSLEISIEMPFEIRSLTSTTHRILFKKTETKATVKLIETEDLDRQFQLLVGLAEIHVPRMWVEQDQDEESEACMLTFYPTFECEQPESGTVIFLIDCSNSMRSGALIYAQAITLLCLHHLQVNWSFNIVAFGSTYEELFPVPCQKTQENTKLAEDFILSVASNMGNTRLAAPLQQHFLLPHRSNVHIQSVFLISDGHVTDSVQNLLDQVAKHFSVCRIFTFGVDTNSVPCNRYLMKSLAVKGAGAFELFDPQVKTKWETKIKSQLKKAAQPVLTDVTVEWQQLGNDEREPIQAPKHTVTLFNGARHVVYGFVTNCTVATLRAKVNGKELSTVVSTSELGKTHGKLLHTLAAKAVIRDWEDGILHKDRMQHEGLKATMKQSIISMSKKYNILTSITSFVAVEKRHDATEQSTNAPTVMEVVSKETVDQLSYIAYEDNDRPEPMILEDVYEEQRDLVVSKPTPSFGSTSNVKFRKVRQVKSTDEDTFKIFGGYESQKVTSSNLDLEDDEESASSVIERSLDTVPLVSQSFAFGSAIRQEMHPPSAPPTTEATTALGFAFGSPKTQESQARMFAAPTFETTTFSSVLKKKVHKQAASLFGATKPYSIQFGGGFGSVATQERSSLFGTASIPPPPATIPTFGCPIATPPPPPPQFLFQRLSAATCVLEDPGQNVTTDSIEVRKKCVKKKKLSFWQTNDKSPTLHTVIDASLFSITQFGSKNNYFGGIRLVSFVITILESKVPENVKKLIQIRTNGKTNDFEKARTEIMEFYKSNHVQVDDDVGEDDVTPTVNQFLSLAKEGFFTLKDVKCLLNTVKIVEKLNEAGIKSLGDAASAVTRMCATLAAILCVVNMFLADDRRQRTNADDLRAAVNRLISCITPINLARFLCALLYVTHIDQRHPMVYNTLQLGNNWETFVASFIEIKDE